MPRPSLITDLVIGRAINTARRRRGLRVSEVAVAAGISQRTMSDYEAGRSQVPEWRLQIIAQAVGLDLRRIVAEAAEGPQPELPPPEPLPPELSPDEAAWLALYHRMPGWMRALFQRHIAARTAASQPAAGDAAACP